MMFRQWPNNHRIFKRQANALISLRVCAGWSESLLVAHTTLLEISCRGSFRSEFLYFTRHKLGWADGSLSDCLAILNAYKSWLNKRETGAFKRSGAGGELGYGKTYYLQIRRLKEVSFH